ncbi:MAG: transcription-repair coupling factor [Bacteroidales bacterium]|nr:transcription-repair coupling factor [Bacteroidales bacterium]
MKTKIDNFYIDDTRLNEILSLCANEKNEQIALSGLSGSAPAWVAAACFQKKSQRVCMVLNDKEIAAYCRDDMVNLLGEENVLFFPSSYKRSADYEKTDAVNIVLKTEVLEKLSKSSKPYFIVSYPEALSEKAIRKKELKENTLRIGTGDKLSMDFVIELLYEFGFVKEDFVYEPGYFAVRGSIIDVFSFSSDKAYRIDFFGDDVESIRSFNPDTQLSENKLKSINIIPNIQEQFLDEDHVSFLDYLAENSLLFFQDIDFCKSQISKIYNNSLEKFKDEEQGFLINPEKHLSNADEFESLLKNYNVIEFDTVNYTDKIRFDFNTSAQPVFGKQFDLLAEDLLQRQDAGYSTTILSENPKQIERLQDIFEAKYGEIEFHAPQYTLYQGFIDHDHLVCLYTDHQIFERYHRFKVKDSFARKDSISLKELQSINPGDFVVHVDSGIGRFGGLTTIENNGKIQEVVTIHYAENDVLFVNIHSLHRISKYRAKDDIAPKLQRLSSGNWKRLKERTKQHLKDIARELILLYAQRSSLEGFAFSPDTYLQHELESSFIYEDTPDQTKVTAEVKTDMESLTPMDRLICGDVGFGKTEIAIRAAFKAVSDGKQVAVLVPTTILALQHYQTFKERLADFPVSISYVSRLRSSKEIKDTLAELKNGKVDILIGTHRIVGADVKFKDLGLLVIDEEQKFGVSVKEKLKKLKLNVDTLTLSATPIPRTMQFSLMGARDLSILSTPPPNRQPIVTEVHSFNIDIIKEAIYYEVNRNGQVFFVNNRIENIHSILVTIQKACPDVSAVVAHGQMKGAELEKIILDFMRGDFDVLISTSIIENGVDIPNANTIIINNANNFGLSDLHQLRGRVGRSNRKAFCYLLAPPAELLSPDSARRLKAIEEFNELGSGFNIALQDLDIRGAGDIFGAEQSGFISNIGFETYNQMITEALQELKETEFKDQFADEIKNKSKPADINFVNDCNIETDFEILFPASYISSTTERINLYRRLDEIKDDEKLQQFSEELIDRFGEMPQEVVELLDVVRLRQLAISLGFQRIIIKNKILIGYFPSNQQSLYYSSNIFSSILKFVQQNPKRFAIKEQNEKLSLRCDKISSIQDALKLMMDIKESI